jgi:hypothetical protein
VLAEERAVRSYSEQKAMESAAYVDLFITTTSIRTVSIEGISISMALLMDRYGRFANHQI